MRKGTQERAGGANCGFLVLAFFTSSFIPSSVRRHGRLPVLISALIGFISLAIPVTAQTEKPVVFKRDDTQLVGVLHLPKLTGKKAPAVLMLHGFTGHKAETRFMFARLGRMLAHRGVAALRFDFAGSGDSQGDFADMTILTELSDARTALEFLHRHEEIDASRIGILGFSMGGCVAALLAGEHRDVGTLILWSPVADPEEHFTTRLAQVKPTTVNGRTVRDLGGLAIGQAFFDVLPRVKPLEALAGFTAPSLVIHGEKDQSVPPSAGKKYADLLRRNNPASRFEEIADGDHTYSSLELGHRVLTHTAEWFAKFLSAPK